MRRLASSETRSPVWDPEDMATIARAIEIPAKRHKRTTISYLDENEIKALLRAPDRSTRGNSITTRNARLAAIHRARDGRRPPPRRHPSRCACSAGSSRRARPP